MAIDFARHQAVPPVTTAFRGLVARGFCSRSRNLSWRQYLPAAEAACGGSGMGSWYTVVWGQIAGIGPYARLD